MRSPLLQKGSALAAGLLFSKGGRFLKDHFDGLSRLQVLIDLISIAFIANHGFKIQGDIFSRFADVRNHEGIGGIAHGDLNGLSHQRFIGPDDRERPFAGIFNDRFFHGIPFFCATETLVLVKKALRTRPGNYRRKTRAVKHVLLTPGMTGVRAIFPHILVQPVVIYQSTNETIYF